jgi:hypothetical protein
LFEEEKNIIQRDNCGFQEIDTPQVIISLSLLFVSNQCNVVEETISFSDFLFISRTSRLVLVSMWPDLCDRMVSYASIASPAKLGNLKPFTCIQISLIGAFC